MRRIAPTAEARSSADGGFTLVEVIVALALMSIVMLSTVAVFIGTVKASAGDQRRQGATQAADAAMEYVRSVAPTLNASGLSNLVSGRTAAAVATQWSALSAAVDLSQTNQASDPNATTSSTPVVPITQAPPNGPVIAGQPYTVNTVVGTCYLIATTCSQTNAGGSVMMFRVIVVVSWTPGNGSTCSGQGCQYVLSTLINPSTDPTFDIRS